MEKYQESKEKAIRHMKLADHILTMTYPLIQDPKLLKLVLRNVHHSMKHLILCLIYNESKHFKIAEFNQQFSQMLLKIKPIMAQHRINPKYAKFLKELNHVVETQQEADVEFIRKDKFVFTSEDYNLNIISKEKLKEYIVKGKLFMKEVLTVTK